MTCCGSKLQSSGDKIYLSNVRVSEKLIIIIPTMLCVMLELGTTALLGCVILYVIKIETTDVY